VSEVDGNMEYRVETVKIGRIKLERPNWVRKEDVMKVEEVARRLEEAMKGYDSPWFKFKEIEVNYCKPIMCEEDKVFITVTLIPKDATEDEDNYDDIRIGFIYNLTRGIKEFYHVTSLADLTTLEQALHVIYLTGKLAVEFYR
jgi:hypothetical protein